MLSGLVQETKKEEFYHAFFTSKPFFWLNAIKKKDLIIIYNLSVATQKFDWLKFPFTVTNELNKFWALKTQDVQSLQGIDLLKKRKNYNLSWLQNGVLISQDLSECITTYKS